MEIMAESAIIISTPYLGDVTISTGSGKQIPYKRIVVNPKIKFEYKGILVSFLPSLILLQIPQTRRWQVNKVKYDP